MLRSKQLPSKLITVSGSKSDAKLSKALSKLLRELSSRRVTVWHDAGERSYEADWRNYLLRSAASAGVVILTLQGGCSQHECERSAELCGSYVNKVELQMLSSAYFEQKNQGPALFKVNNLSSRVTLKAFLQQGDTRAPLQLEKMSSDGSSSDFKATGDTSSLLLGKANLVLADDEQPLDSASPDKWPQLSVVYRKVEFPTTPSASATDPSGNDKAPSPIWLAIRQGVIYSYQIGFNQVPISKMQLYKYNQQDSTLGAVPGSRILMGSNLLFAIAKSSALNIIPDPLNSTPTFSYLNVCPAPATAEQVDIATCMTQNGKIPDGKITKPIAADRNGTYVAVIDNQSYLRAYMIIAGGGSPSNFLNPVTLLEPVNPKKARLAVALELTRRTAPLPSDLLAIKEDGTVETYLQAMGGTLGLNYDPTVAEKSSALTGAESLSSLLYSSEPAKSPSALAVGDLDGDGADDLAAVRGNEVSLLLNQSYLGYKATDAPILAPWPVDAVAIGDINGDGKADVVVANNSAHSIAAFLSK